MCLSCRVHMDNPPKDEEVGQEHTRVVRSWVWWNYIVCVWEDLSGACAVGIC